MFGLLQALLIYVTFIVTCGVIVIAGAKLIYTGESLYDARLATFYFTHWEKLNDYTFRETYLKDVSSNNAAWHSCIKQIIYHWVV